MKINICTLFSLLLLLTGATGTHAQVKKSIQPVFNANEQFELKNTISTESFYQKQQVLKDISGFTLALNVIGKDTTGKVIMQAQYIKQNRKIENIAKSEINGYNSDDPDEFIKASKREEERIVNQGMREFADAMQNKPFTIYFNEKSVSVEVTGIDTLVTEALKMISDSDALDLDAYGQDVRSTINNAAVAGYVKEAFSYLPGKPVGRGDGWSKNIKVANTDLKLGYLVKSVQGDSIGIEAEASTENNEYKLAVSQKGNLTIDAKTGLLIRSVMRSEVKPIPGIRRYLILTTEQYELTRVTK
jgi:hypothetical protein